MSYKAALRKAAPAVYTFAVKLRSSDLVTRIGFVGRAREVRSTQALNGGYFAVNIQGKRGLAATLAELIAVIIHCNRNHLTPIVKFTNPLYTNHADGQHNWFTDFFDYVAQIPADLVESLHFSDINGHLDFSQNRLFDSISIEEANQLFYSYAKIKTDAIREAISYAGREFSGQMLGIHYRGTDKKYEAPRIQFQRMDEFIAQVLEIIRSETGLTIKVFVSTDEPDYLDHLMRGPLRDRITYFECNELSVGGNPIHFSPGDKHRKGVEALSIMYLLSKCSWCIKTNSYLSAWAKILNPKLKVYIPEKPFRDSFHFPDKQVWESREQI